jgi:predicted component of type VI protein secretion system
VDVKLVWFKTNGERRDFALINDLTTIGRRDDCDLRIPLGQISRRHCQISKTPQGVFIRDLGSANGTFVNNQRVRELPLSAGDHVIVGPIHFVVQVDGQPADIMPPPPPTPQVGADGGDAGGYAVETSFAHGPGADPISALESLAEGGDERRPKDPFGKR